MTVQETPTMHTKHTNKQTEATVHMQGLIADFLSTDSKWKEQGRPGMNSFTYAARTCAFQFAMGALAAYIRCGVIGYDEYNAHWKVLYDTFFTPENNQTMIDAASALSA